MKWSETSKKYILFSAGTFFIFSLVFAEFAYKLIKDELVYFDQWIIDKVLMIVSPKLTIIMSFFTSLGSSKTLLAFLFIAIVAMLLYKKNWEAIFLLFGTAGGLVLNEILKSIFQRQRPTLHRLIEVNGYSFPSGHSMSSFIFYGMVCIFLFTFLSSRAIKAIFFFITVFLILMIGLSRIYLGVHYPSDVIAGFAAGGAWLAVCIMGWMIITGSWRAFEKE